MSGKKPSHFRLVQVGFKRLTHTPYRCRQGSIKQNDNQQYDSSVADDFQVNDEHKQTDVDIELENLIFECRGLLASEKEDAKKWSDRMEELHSLWENNRSTILKP
ncbi:uncharacterized protein LOC124455246 [Xenia sp. Carnegie-2017]|uniref:uncharacterized protein LOC124455246 n=1 Tax=Xenia sp. Carnegie-2017 TaxID=2897299 RepID=UPI001F036B77|nr:uncharacterized protein LOC124455246 [Xenia sp. Carnegie-2017]